MGKLTDIEIKNLIKAGKPLAKSDGDGLTFTLSSSGTAAWTLRYRFGGKQRELTIGRYPDVTLAMARDLAAKKRVAVNDGVDVATAKQDERRAAEKAAQLERVGTVKALYGEWFPRMIGRRWKNPRQVAGVFDLYILPALGHLAVADVRRADIAAMLRPLIDRGILPTARKVRQYTEMLFDWAIEAELIEANPAARRTRKRKGSELGQVTSRDRALSLAELAAFFQAMRGPNFPPYAAAALKLLLATGARKMELLKSTWDEFDLVAGDWRIPGGRTKTGAAIRIPLSPWALAILKEQAARRINDYVFPVLMRSKRKITGHLGETALNFALFRMKADIAHFTVHDLRRTTRTHLAALGVAPHIAEMCLNHKPGKGIEAVYNVYDYFEERRAALFALADLLAQCERGEVDKVIPIHSRKKSA